MEALRCPDVARTLGTLITPRALIWLSSHRLRFLLLLSECNDISHLGFRLDNIGDFGPLLRLFTLVGILNTP